MKLNNGAECRILTISLNKIAQNNLSWHEASSLFQCFACKKLISTSLGVILAKIFTLAFTSFIFLELIFKGRIYIVFKRFLYQFEIYSFLFSGGLYTGGAHKLPFLIVVGLSNKVSMEKKICRPLSGVS